MGKIALPRDEQIITVLGQDETNIRGVLIPCHASANTLGAWVQVGSALPYDVSGFWLDLGPNTTSANDMLFNVGIGATPQPIFSNLLLNSITALYSNFSVWIPRHLPAGTVISCQLQGSSGGTAKGIYAIIRAVSMGWPVPPGISSWDAIGFRNSGVTGGTDLSGYFGAAGAKGTWLDLGATARDYLGYYVAFGMQNVVRTTNYLRQFFDIAISSTPDIIMADLTINYTYNTFPPHPIKGPFWRPIKAGTHIYVRPQGLAVTTNDPKVDVVFYGAY